MAKFTNEQMRARLQQALDRGGNCYEIEDIAEAVKAGTMQYWGTEDAFIITMIGVYPRKKVLLCLFGCGDLDAVMSFQDELVAFGKVHGCEYMSIDGRPGWKKVLPHYGWDYRGVSFTYVI